MIARSADLIWLRDERGIEFPDVDYSLVGSETKIDLESIQEIAALCPLNPSRLSELRNMIANQFPKLRLSNLELCPFQGRVPESWPGLRALYQLTAPQPPSTGTLAPVMKDAAGEQSQTIKAATSSGSTIRPIGCSGSINSSVLLVPPVVCSASEFSIRVSIPPGQTESTRMPWVPYSSAASSWSARSRRRRRQGERPEWTRPAAERIHDRTSPVLQHLRDLGLKAQKRAAQVHVDDRVEIVDVLLRERRNSALYACVIAGTIQTAKGADSGSDKVPDIARLGHVSAVKNRLTAGFFDQRDSFLATVGITSETTTFAPSRAKHSAVARPIPAPDPVTSATLSVTNPMTILTPDGFSCVIRSTTRPPAP